MSGGTYVISADAGGTFLDLVLTDGAGRIGVGKALHNPARPVVGIMDAVSAAAAQLELTAEEVLERCEFIFYGTTVTTNGIIERKGVRTGLLCTAGFEDTLYIGRVRARTEGLDTAQISYYAHADRPPPIVPFALIRGIRERLDWRGRELAPLDPSEVEGAVASLVAEGVEAVAISFLHSHANPAHEVAARRIVHERFPQLHIVLSCEIAPVMGEFERTNTAVVNAYLNPLLGSHIDNLKRALSGIGYDRDVLIMQSIGGVIDAEVIRDQSVMTLLSGPVGGIIGAQQIGALIGEKNIVTTDMGGTSFDVGVVVGGSPQYAHRTTIHRQVLIVPTVDIETIGAGGGSVISLDENRNIRIGPESAGARPGPACYGLGGQKPTVTDADVVLGFIDPATLVVGDRTADRDLAIAAFQREIGDPLGMSAVEAADAVLQIVNNRMADLVRKATIERGYDPRDFIILAYGGSGPAHCTAYGAEIGARKIVVPPYASVFSAYGIAHADVKRSFVRAVTLELKQGATPSVAFLEELARAHDDVAAQAAAAEQRPGALLAFSLDVQFAGQLTEITVPIEEGFPLDGPKVRAIVERFRHTYELNYGAGASSPISDIEITNLRADLVVTLPSKYSPKPMPERTTGQLTPQSHRPVFWGVRDQWRDTPVFAASSLMPGDVVNGPALIEPFKTAVPIFEGQRATLDAFRNLVIEPRRLAAVEGGAT